MSQAAFSVLLLDDDFHTRELFKLVFTHYALDLDTVTTTDAALEYLREHTPDVVVVDLVMPDSDGFAALAAFRELPTSPQMRFVATTAYHTSDTAETVFEHGFHGFLPKPFSVDDLISKLRRVTQQ